MGRPHSIKYGLVCEDIRREDNGKLIIIGMYGQNISLSAVPVGLQLSFLVAVHAGGAGREKIEIDVSLNDEELAKVSGEIEFDAKGLALVTLPRGVMPIRAPGDLVLRARLSDDQWTELWRGPVSIKAAELNS
jgi:hypothetical protein